MRAFANGRLWIGIAVSVVCLWLAVHSLPLAVVLQELAQARYVWLFPAIGLQLLAVVAQPSAGSYYSGNQNAWRTFSGLRVSAISSPTSFRFASGSRLAL